jgi:prepilin-type N-terminal cleavage/methylation domain-containing protein
MKLSFPDYSVRAVGWRGFTLPEVLVAITLGVIFLGAVALTSMTFLRDFAGMYNYTDMNFTSRQALDKIARDVRTANYVNVANSNELQLVNTNFGTSVTYTWNSDSGALLREAVGDSTNKILKDCDTWVVSLYNRAPTTNYDNNTNTAGVSDAKLVSMQWRCYRSILGIHLNTETMKEARIVIRN